MKAKSKADRPSVRLAYMEILLALALLGAVFLTAAHSDMVSARQQMAATVQYIREQCNRYNRIELASETKSLMRVMESVGQIARQMEADGGARAPLSEYAQTGYVSGLVVMDETGRVLSDYHETGEAPRHLGEYLESPALLDAALYPEKRYATRFTCADGSMVDLAAAGRRDAPGVVAAYYRTPVEYLDSFRLSITLMLSGYSPETSGTIVVTSDSKVVASNDETLIGGNTEEMTILRQIRQAYRSGELVRASQPEGSFRQYFGMMGCGRNFYVYVYMTEKAVFATTPQNMLFALIFYAVIFAFAKAIRFRTAQSYQEQQYRVQKEYAEKLRRERRAERRRGSGGSRQRGQDQLSFPHEPRHSNAAERGHRSASNRRRASKRYCAADCEPGEDEGGGQSSAQPHQRCAANEQAGKRRNHAGA